MGAFRERWAEYLIDEADKELKPMIGLYPERDIFKPKSLYQRYDLGGPKM